MDDLDAAFGFTEAADRAASAGACAAPPPPAGCSFWDELSTLQPSSFTPSTPLPPTACPFNDRSRVEAKVASILAKKDARAAAKAQGSKRGGRGSADLDLQQRFLFDDDHLEHSTTHECSCGCHCSGWFDKADVELIR